MSAFLLYYCSRVVFTIIMLVSEKLPCFHVFFPPLSFSSPSHAFMTSFTDRNGFYSSVLILSHALNIEAAKQPLSAYELTTKVAQLVHAIICYARLYAFKIFFLHTETGRIIKAWHGGVTFKHIFLYL